MNEHTEKIHLRFERHKKLLGLYIQGTESRWQVFRTTKCQDIFCFRVGRTLRRSGEVTYGVKVVAKWHMDIKFMDRVSGIAEEVEALVGRLSEMLNEFRGREDEEVSQVGREEVWWSALDSILDTMLTTVVVTSKLIPGATFLRLVVWPFVVATWMPWFGGSDVGLLRLRLAEEWMLRFERIVMLCFWGAVLFCTRVVVLVGLRDFVRKTMKEETVVSRYNDLTI